MISAMRSKLTTKLILIGKTDLDTAYRQIHANTTTTLTCISILDELTFICLWLPFGTTPSPEEYTTISEAEIDLGNNIFRDEFWDTDYPNSPHQ